MTKTRLIPQILNQKEIKNKTKYKGKQKHSKIKVILMKTREVRKNEVREKELRGKENMREKKVK